MKKKGVKEKWMRWREGGGGVNVNSGSAKLGNDKMQTLGRTYENFAMDLVYFA